MAELAHNPAHDRHRIPAIDRMMDILFLLEKRTQGAGIRELVDQLGLPRSTVYRILNSLERHDMVRRSSSGAYRLGARLLALASRAVGEGLQHDLVALSRPHLQDISMRTGEACKISVITGDEVLVIAGSDGKREYALTIVAGQRLPLYAGAASKVLLAYQPAAAINECLSAPLTRFTTRTITDPKRLKLELARIRRQGWAQDKGEYSQSIHAFAAPIRDGDGKVIAALSVPFLAGASAAHMEEVKAATIAGAAVITSDLPLAAKRRKRAA